MTPAESRGRFATLVAAGALLHAAPAAAQSAEAEILFRDGRELIRNGKLAEGCNKLAASERLESSAGTLLNLGDCRERLGALASAWAAFRKAEAKAKHAGDDEKRRAEARRRASLLEPRLSNLVLQIESRIEGLVARRDGEVIDPALWNTAVPLDPGTYEIIVEAPGHRSWSIKVSIDPRIRRRVIEVPALERASVADSLLAPAPRTGPGALPLGPISATRPGATGSGIGGALGTTGTTGLAGAGPRLPLVSTSPTATESPSTESPLTAPPALPSPAATAFPGDRSTPGPRAVVGLTPSMLTPGEASSSSGGGTWTTARKISAALAAVGVGALGTGAYFGWRAHDFEDQADDRCPLEVCSDREGLQLNERARGAALRANLLYATGGAMAATAAVLWILGKPDQKQRLRPDVSSSGVSLRGTF